MADNRKLAQGLMMMTPSARADLAQREEDVQRGKTVELLRRAGKEMYDNPIVNTAIGFTPVLGDVQAAGETMAALNRGAPWQETAGYAAGMLPFVPMIGKTVWHGSPKIFDEFNLNLAKEGGSRSARGEGLYFSESPDFASSFRAAGGEGGNFGLEAGPTQGIANLLAYKGEKGEELARKYYPKLENIDEQIAIAKKAIDENSGLYKVDLPDEQIAKMIDYDLPLSQQSESVREALLKVNDPYINEALTTNPVYNEVGDYWSHMGNTYGSKNEALQDVMPANIISGQRGEFKSPQEVSHRFYEAGIPGTQYAERGTRNYVVFSDEIPQILERNGQPVAQALRNYEAPQAQALREAEEYGQKMLGLPPGNTPMDRAIAGGFEPMYHGTADEIVNLNPEKYGSSTGAQSAKQGFWGVKTVPTAEGYANYAAKQAPVQKLLNEADVAGNKGDWDKYDDLLRQAEELETDVYNQPLRGQNVMPLMVNTKNAKIVDMGGAEYTDVEGGINQYLKQGKREGKDVVVLENLSDDPGRSNMQTTHFGVLNPAAVRSQFAAFDPRYFGKPGLMLGAGGLGVYGALQGEDEYQ